MREDPGLGIDKISACLDAHYGLGVASVSFLPLGYDPSAAVYRIIADGGGSYFLKVRFGTVHEPSLLVPRALIDLGIRNVVAPLRTRSSGLWRPLDGHSGHSVVLYPFVGGESAVASGLSDDQWRDFGSTLRDVHASGLGERLRGRLPVEAFSLPAAATVRRLLTMVGEMRFESAAASRLAEFWRGRGADPSNGRPGGGAGRGTAVQAVRVRSVPRGHPRREHPRRRRRAGPPDRLGQASRRPDGARPALRRRLEDRTGGRTSGGGSVF